MSYNRAAYQRINPNMSTKQAVRLKKPVLLFKDKEGLTFSKYLTPSNLKTIVAHNPTMTATSILITMLDGGAFKLANGLTVTISYR